MFSCARLPGRFAAVAFTLLGACAAAQAQSALDGFDPGANWRHATTGEVWVWPMDGAVKQAGYHVGTVPDTGYRIIR